MVRRQSDFANAGLFCAYCNPDVYRGFLVLMIGGDDDGEEGRKDF